jgi:multidrug efflux pump subunit AcrA (membrane-fusion protein)
MDRKLVILIVTLLVIVAGGAYLAVTPAAREIAWARLQQVTQDEDGPLVVSGFIEAEQIEIAPEQGGRVTALLVGEGDEVATGDALARLDTSVLDAQTAAARAAADVAQAQLELALADTRPEEIRRAEAHVAHSEALRDGARQAWQDLQAQREDPQPLTARIAQAEAEVAARQAALTQAVALKDSAEIAYDSYWEGKEALAKAQERISQIPEPLRPPLPGVQLSFHQIPNQYWRAWIAVNTAQAALDGARATLHDLRAMKANLQALNTEISAAEAEYRSAQAAVDLAQAKLDQLRAGPTGEEIAALEAQVEQAEALIEMLIVQHTRQTLTAPTDGLVLEVSVREGELARPGGPLVTLGKLDAVDLTVYVPEARLGEVSLGQQVLVSVDSFPDQEFAGTVVAIASEAEFTPRNVQTRQDRVAMVFAVEVRIPNPNHTLKPGVAADARLVTEGR